MFQKPTIQIDVRALKNHMAARKIRSYTELAADLYRQGLIEDISNPSVLRWNREGWPEFKFRALCNFLRCKPRELASPVQH